MIAYMVKDEYRDLAPDYPYEVIKVYSSKEIMLKGSPRRYSAKSFKITHNNKIITVAEAYRIYKYESIAKKLGMKK